MSHICHVFQRQGRVIICVASMVADSFSHLLFKQIDLNIADWLDGWFLANSRDINLPERQYRERI